MIVSSNNSAYFSFNLEKNLPSQNEVKDRNQRIESLAVKKFSESYKKNLQDLIDISNVDNFFLHKGLANLFLDKAERLLGKNHSLLPKIQGQMFGGASFASMQMIELLNETKSNIDEKVLSIINTWIACEHEFLRLAIIFDGWRLQSKEIVGVVLEKNPEKKRELLAAITQIKVPPDEIEKIAKAVAKHLKKLTPGAIFKLPSGSLIHETRWVIKKKEDSYTLYDYNTGDGAITLSTWKYSSISKEIIENFETWKLFIQTKLSPTMTANKNILSNLKSGSAIDKMMQKSLQEENSCSLHCLSAEFKHFFIRQYSDLNTGWLSYKQYVGGLKKTSHKISHPTGDPGITALLLQRAKLQQRYLDWSDKSIDSEKYHQAKIAYAKSIVLLLKQTKSPINIRGLFYQLAKKDTCNILQLRCLDKIASQLFRHAGLSQILELRKEFSKALTFGGVNYLGLRELMLLENNLNNPMDDSQNLLEKYFGIAPCATSYEKTSDEYHLSPLTEFLMAYLGCSLGSKILGNREKIALSKEAQKNCLDLISEIFNDQMIDQLDIGDLMKGLVLAKQTEIASALEKHITHSQVSDQVYSSIIKVMDWEFTDIIDAKAYAEKIEDPLIRAQSYTDIAIRCGARFRKTALNLLHLAYQIAPTLVLEDKLDYKICRKVIQGLSFRCKYQKMITVLDYIKSIDKKALMMVAIGRFLLNFKKDVKSSLSLFNEGLKLDAESIMKEELDLSFFHNLIYILSTESYQSLEDLVTQNLTAVDADLVFSRLKEAQSTQQSSERRSKLNLHNEWTF